MQRHILIVLTNAVDDRDDEYNEWYDTVHLPEVVALPGFVSAQRYKIGAPLRGSEPASHKYVAIYDIESDDVDSVLQGLAGAVPAMTMSSALDLSSVVTYTCTALGARVEAA